MVSYKKHDMNRLHKLVYINGQTYAYTDVIGK